MKDFKYIKRGKILNPIIICLYIIGCYYLADLAQYGGIRRRVPIILITFPLILIWFIYVFVKIRNQPLSGIIYPDASEITKKSILSKWWFYTAIVILTLTTLITGYNIYQSAIPYNGKLSWYIEDHFNKKEITYEKNNIYTDGLNGMLAAIEEEVTLPHDLYLSDSFTVTYAEGGQITDLYGFIYGIGAENETESFLISYDVDQSDEIQVHLDGYVDATYDETKIFQPFVDALKVVDLEPFGEMLLSETINLSYQGFRTIQEASDPIHYYNEEGLTPFINYGQHEHVGYSFILESPSTQIHFIQFDEEALLEQQRQQQEQAELDANPNYFGEELISEEYFLGETIGYQLVELDAATGSRFYGLRRSTDGGASWTMHNSDPFLGSMGVAAGLTFIDENLGFAALSRNGGSEATLFRTTDGGRSFERMEIPAMTVEQNGAEFQPFDFPEMPYEEDGQLILYVGQGSNGDYQRGAKTIFISDDDGTTFEFHNVEE